MNKDLVLETLEVIGCMVFMMASTFFFLLVGGE